MQIYTDAESEALSSATCFSWLQQQHISFSFLPEKI